MSQKKLTMSLSDSAQKFIFEKANIRGVIVHLTQSFQTLLKQHAYPLPVQKQMGEILLAATLLFETLKLEGRMTIQFQSDGAIKMLVAQINHEGQLRALAQWDASATENELEKGLGDGSLVISIFKKNQKKPTQSIVSLQRKNIRDALAFYFLQSEQLPTIFAFAVKENRASGMLLQAMPEHANPDRAETWKTMAAHVDKIDINELLYDNNVSFLQHYFPEEDIRLFDSRDLVFYCGCSIEKMESAIRTIGQEEANLILKEKSEIVVTCEYCNHQYGFDRSKVEAIFD